MSQPVVTNPKPCRSLAVRLFSLLSIFLTRPFAMALAITAFATSAQAQSICSANGVQLQILGSGGPFGSGRASAGYLLWIDGQSRLMVDAGGGTFARFHEAGANLQDLEKLALSHFHPGHSAELPALLWPQNGELTISGPSGSAEFPSVDAYLDGLLGPNGVFRVLNQRFDIDSVMIDVGSPATEVLSSDSMTISAKGVPHGDVPTLAYRVETSAGSIAFSSDQNGSDPSFTEFVQGVDVLVVHFAGNEDGSGRGDLHAKPSVWGKIASDANVGRLVLSHLMSNQNIENNVDALKQVWTGPLTIAEDLMCLEIK